MWPSRATGFAGSSIKSFRVRIVGDARGEGASAHLGFRERRALSSVESDSHPHFDSVRREGYYGGTRSTHQNVRAEIPSVFEDDQNRLMSVRFWKHCRIRRDDGAWGKHAAVASCGSIGHGIGIAPIVRAEKGLVVAENKGHNLRGICGGMSCTFTSAASGRISAGMTRRFQRSWPPCVRRGVLTRKPNKARSAQAGMMRSR